MGKQIIERTIECLDHEIELLEREIQIEVLKDKLDGMRNPFGVEG